MLSVLFALAHIIWFFYIWFFVDNTLQNPDRPTAEKAKSKGEAPVVDTKSTAKDAMKSIVKTTEKPTAKATSRPKKRRG